MLFLILTIFISVHINIYSYMLSTLSIRHLTMQIIVALNSQSDNSYMPPYLKLIPMSALSLQTQFSDS